jgi:putative oxidoreductase
MEILILNFSTQGECMNRVAMVSRYLLGLIYFVFGLNGFLQFIPVPPMPEAAQAFMGGLASSGYFFPFLKTVEILSGLALLSGLFVPLALIVLAPITLNIFLFHAMLAPDGMPLAVVMVILHGFLGFYLLNTYKPLLKMKS